MLSLDRKMRAKLANMIALLQDNGYELRERRGREYEADRRVYSGDACSD